MELLSLKSSQNVYFLTGFGTEALCLFSLSFIYDGSVAIAMLSVGVSLGGLAVSGKSYNKRSDFDHQGSEVRNTQTARFELSHTLSYM